MSSKLPTRWGFNDSWRLMSGWGGLSRVSLAQGLGATVLRVPTYWNGIQTTNAASYNWSQGYSQIYSACQTAGIQIIWALQSAPNWANDNSTGGAAPGFAQSNAVQVINFNNGVPAGFTLTWNGQTTSTISTPATASQVLSALNALTGFPAGVAVYANSDVALGQPVSYTVVFPSTPTGGLMTAAVSPAPSGSSSNVQVAGKTPSAVTTVTVSAKSMAGQGFLPSSDHLDATTGLQAFVAALVAQFPAPTTLAIEAWNEPNSWPFSAPVPDPVGFAAVQKAVWLGANPGGSPGTIKVMTPGLAPENTLDNAIDMSTRDYFLAMCQQLYAANGNAVVSQPPWDVAAIHLYPGTASGVDVATDPNDPSKQYAELQVAMAQAKQLGYIGATTPIGITEFGYPQGTNTGTGSGTGEPGAGSLTQQQQATAWLQYGAFGLNVGAWCQIIHRLIDDGTDTYGMYDYPGSAPPNAVANSSLVPRLQLSAVQSLLNGP